MGKRSEFDRIPRDFYPTPPAGVEPLLPHLQKWDVRQFCEPCAGDGQLIDTLEQAGLMCCYKSDIEPRRSDIVQHDALELEEMKILEADAIITNPPWRRDLLHLMIEYFMSLKPTWLLFDADWIHTKQARELISYCRLIVSVGRVKWVPDSKHVGKDNVCWYYFTKYMQTKETEFIGRQ